MSIDIKYEMFVFKKEFDLRLNDFLENKKTELGEIDQTLFDLVDKMLDQIMRSGKRIRPFLTCQAYLLSGGDQNDDLIWDLCVGIELLHQYLMIHDDVIDKDEKRYGGDSLHVYYENQQDDDHFGLSMAVISGDLLISMVNQIFLNLPASDGVRLELHSLLHQTIQKTTAGWQIHFLQNKKSISEIIESEYIKGMEMVSGFYTFMSPLMMGCIAAGNTEYISDLKNYGSNAGLAFQIGDDLLGIFGDSEKTGKPAGNDFREGKKTLLILRAYKNSSNEQQIFMDENMGTNITQKQLDELKDLLTSSGSMKHSQNLIYSHTEEAKKSLENLPDYINTREILESMADYLVDREK